jgi:anti-sigma regulatory factor (Ser/Thr protein kinase)
MLDDEASRPPLLHLTIPATVEGMNLVHRALCQCLTTLGATRALEPNWRAEFTLAVAEVAANIIQYAYPPGTSQPQFTLTVWSESDRLKARLEDAGVRMVWPNGELPAAELPPDLFSERGRGLAIIRLATDRFEYQRTAEGKNRWLIEKRLPV